MSFELAPEPGGRHPTLPVTLCVYDLACIILIHFNIAGAIDNEGPPAAGTISPKLSNTYALLAAMMFSVRKSSLL